MENCPVRVSVLYYIWNCSFIDIETRECCSPRSRISVCWMEAMRARTKSCLLISTIEFVEFDVLDGEVLSLGCDDSFLGFYEIRFCIERTSKCESSTNLSETVFNYSRLCDFHSCKNVVSYFEINESNISN